MCAAPSPAVCMHACLRLAVWRRHLLGWCSGAGICVACAALLQSHACMPPPPRSTSPLRRASLAERHCTAALPLPLICYAPATPAPLPCSPPRYPQVVTLQPGPWAAALPTEELLDVADDLGLFLDYPQPQGEAEQAAAVALAAQQAHPSGSVGLAPPTASLHSHAAVASAAWQSSSASDAARPSARTPHGGGTSVPHLQGVPPEAALCVSAVLNAAQAAGMPAPPAGQQQTQQPQQGRTVGGAPFGCSGSAERAAAPELYHAPDRLLRISVKVHGGSRAQRGAAPGTKCLASARAGRPAAAAAP